MKTALFYADRNFVGPEYLRQLDAAGVEVSRVVAVGRFADEQIARERERTGGLWHAPEVPADRIDAKFESLRDPGLWKLVQDEKIDVVVQGGIGILKPDMLTVPAIGFLNIHPGRLPEYRGNACPEWAVHNGDDVHLTAHLIDEGIDTGPVICSRRYGVAVGWSYEAFRANLYAACGLVAAEALRALGAAGAGWRDILQPQREDHARYRPPIPAEVMEKVRQSFPGWQPARKFEEIDARFPKGSPS